MRQQIRLNQWRSTTLLGRVREAVQLLLEWGADIEATDHDNITALHLAAREAHRKAVQLLLEWGAKVEAKDHSQLTALQLAAREAHREAVQLLLEWGAKIEVKDHSQSTLTALHWRVIGVWFSYCLSGVQTLRPQIMIG